MRFSYAIDDKSCELIFTLDDPDSDEITNELIGSRDQTPYGPVKWYKDQDEIKVKFYQKIDLKSAHPDLLALAGLTLVYPFLKKKVQFAKPISSRLASALAQFPLKEMKDGRYVERGFLSQIGPVDPELEPYELVTERTEFGVAYGGGLDSTAIKVLYPEAWLIHDTEDKENETTRQWKNHDRFVGIQTETRNVHRGVGWTSWTSCLTLSLLLATELNLKCLMYGTNLGDFFRTSTNKGKDKYKRKYRVPERSPWLDLFQASGLPVFSPILGLSSLSTAGLTVNGDLVKKACWCYRGNNKKACHHCPKCFRKEILLACFHKGPLVPVTRDRTAVRKEGQMWPPSWRRYPDHRVVKMLNTYDFGPSLHRAFGRLVEIQGLHPKMLKTRNLARLLQDPSMDQVKQWLDDGRAYYQLAIDLIVPKEYQTDLKDRLSRFGFKALSEEEAKFLINWSLPKN